MLSLRSATGREFQRRGATAEKQYPESSLPTDNSGAVVIVERATDNIVRTVLCCIVYWSCVIIEHIRMCSSLL